MAQAMRRAILARRDKPETSRKLVRNRENRDQIHARRWKELRRNLAGMTFFVVFS
jgi:hypothetical protein